MESEIRAGRDFSTKIDGAGQAAQAVIHAFIAQIVAAIDGPIVSQAEKLAVERAAAEAGRQKTAFTRQPLECFVESGEIEERHARKVKGGVVADRAIMRNDIELGGLEPPPGLRNSTIRDESFVQNVAIRLTLRSFALEVERIAGGQQAGPRHDLGRRCPAHVPEDPGL